MSKRLVHFVHVGGLLFIRCLQYLGGRKK